MGPLASLKIVELAGLGPCPLAGQLLADLGAEVIVIDRSSDDSRQQDVNRRGKRSIALDLKNPAGIKTALKIIEKADILIEGFRPGVMERLGLGPEECLETNPQLVYGRMTGWGQDGPLAKSAGHDLNYLAVTGALHAMGKKSEPPVPPLNLVADYGGGAMFLIMGVLSALFARQTSGKGQVVDAAMIEGVPAMMGLIHSMLGNGLWSAEREDNFVDGGAPYYRCYETSDQRYISVACIEPQFFKEFLELAGLDSVWLAKQNHKSSWPKMHQLFEQKIASKTRDEWAAIFEGTDACVAPVLNFAEAANHHHNKSRKVFIEVDGMTQTKPVPEFSFNKPDTPRQSNARGSDGKSVLKENGLSEQEIIELASTGVLL